MKNGTDHEEILFFFIVKNEIGVVSKFVFCFKSRNRKGNGTKRICFALIYIEKRKMNAKGLFCSRYTVKKEYYQKNSF